MPMEACNLDEWIQAAAELPFQDDPASPAGASGVDLKKIIVKKQTMERAVERLGGGRRGALLLWKLVQVWLEQKQAGKACKSNAAPEEEEQQQQPQQPVNSSIDSAAAATRAARKNRMAQQRRLSAHKRPRMSSMITSTSASSSCRLDTPSNETGSLVLLMHKDLRPSDVGNLGRIVLPKKEAESHLPCLGTRQGMALPMEDMLTSQLWHFKYRFWPNNRSRMYILENTGEFVRCYSLREGDSIFLYGDSSKSGRYVIHARKNGAGTICDTSYGCCLDGNTGQEALDNNSAQLDCFPELERLPSLEMGDMIVQQFLGVSS